MPEKNPKAYLKIIEQFQKQRILVIGDLMIDEYLRGRVSRLSPEAPVPVVDLESESLRFGGASNVALNLKTLGCQPLLVGMVGDDRMGDAFFGLMQDNDLPVDGLVVSRGRPTTVKTRVIGDNQHIARVDREVTTYISGEEMERVRQTIEKFVPKCSAIILQDYNKGCLPKELIHHILDIANQYNKIVTVDPKFTNFLEYRNATVFKPNIKEASQALARVIASEDEIMQAGADLLNQMKAKCVLLTLGARGMALFRPEKKILHIPTKTRKVADVSGAGDTVISTMTAALTGAADFDQAAFLANQAAGLVCEEVGIVPIQKDILIGSIAGDPV